jgi:hypothetical protein
MRRKFVKYMAGGMGAIGLVIVFASGHYFIGGNSAGLFGLLFGGIWAAVGLSRYFRINKFENRSFEWYRRKHPELCGSNGRVSCKNCNGKQIRARGLMQHSYTREHFCGVCGTTLYYTPEG